MADNKMLPVRILTQPLHFHFHDIFVVVLAPDESVTHVGGAATCTCTVAAFPVMSVEWLVNETSLNSRPLHNVELAFAAGVGILRFNDVSQDYNNTRIQCLANMSTEVLSSEISLLHVQGIMTFYHIHSLSLCFYRSPACCGGFCGCG